MPHFPPAARGHLRLAGTPAEPTPAESKALLLVRAALVLVALVFLTAVAWVSAAVALAPILWRRSPLGCRLRPLRPPEARVIPFQPRADAERRNTALPR